MEELELYIDRFKAGEYKDFSLLAKPAIMESADNEASFEKDLIIKGSATIANDHLILNIAIDTDFINYCTICNEPITHPLHIKENHMAFSLKKMKSGVFSLKETIRELVFLNLPRFSECEGNCPERAAIDKYLKNIDHLREESHDNKE